MALKKWLPGQSGNPAGRPPHYKKVGALRELIGKNAPKVVKVLLENALNGDVSAAKILIERCIPIIKPVELQTTLEGFNNSTLTEQAKRVVAELAKGQFPTGQASAILNGLSILARLNETEELEQRVAALENEQLTKPDQSD